MRHPIYVSHLTQSDHNLDGTFSAMFGVVEKGRIPPQREMDRELEQTEFCKLSYRTVRSL